MIKTIIRLGRQTVLAARMGLAFGVFLLCFGVAVGEGEIAAGAEEGEAVAEVRGKRAAARARKAKEKEGVEKGSEEKESVMVVRKKVKGEVNAITPRMIVVGYDKKIVGGKVIEESEIDLPYGADLDVVNKKNLDGIKAGDTVVVHYEEEMEEYDEENEDGVIEHKTRVVGRKARKITLLRTGREAGSVLRSGG